ncbi:MAG: ABC transporter ATP-binding protein [Anaerolineae bacterium]|nr:ABC transporter ATP-binding protein [Anaerolineae bacterium]
MESNIDFDALKQHAIIYTEGLARVYKARGLEVHALRDLNVVIPEGGFVAFRGRSGSGKTTLINCISGLDRPSSGEVYLREQPMSRLSDHKMTMLRRREFSFVFQSFALLPTFSAFENIELPLRIKGMGRRERRDRTMRALSVVGLSKWAKHRPYEMSGGQQQRVAVARALVTTPEVIMADEPTGELDSTTGRQIMALFQQISVEENVTIVMVTHDPVIEEYASLVYELLDGQVIRATDYPENR